MYKQSRLYVRSLQFCQLKQLRFVSQQKVIDESNDMGTLSQAFANAKPFSEIPGPTKFEFIRGFFPGGIYFKQDINYLFRKNRELYGDIFVLPGVFGKNSFVISYNPDDYPLVIRSEGIWPWRRRIETLTYHRTVHRKNDFKTTIGILSTNDEAWAKVRGAVNPILMQPQNARLYLNNMLEVNNEFLQRIREIRDPNTLEMPDTFEDEINRLTFETVAVVALNQQIGLIRKNRENKDAKILFQSIRNIFQLIVDLDMNPSIWKMYKTPKFNQIMKNYDNVYDISMKYINQALEKIENNTSTESGHEEKSVLEKLLQVDRNLAVVMAMDLLFAGVDTTSSTITGILFAIAKNPEKQEKLRQEMRKILPEKDTLLTADTMKNLPYLRACIKEGIRMYPIGGGTQRTNTEDVVMSGYQIPKFKEIFLMHNMLLLEEKYCAKANEFIPERWLRSSEKSDNIAVNPFLNMPFGFGPRSCVGKRIVDMELEITIARLVRNFYIEFNYSLENAYKNRLINVPAIPLRFKFTEVEN